MAGFVVGELEVFAGELGEAVEVWWDDMAGCCRELSAEVVRNCDVLFIPRFRDIGWDGDCVGLEVHQFMLICPSCPLNSDEMKLI